MLGAVHATVANLLAYTTPSGGASSLAALDPEPLGSIVAATALLINTEAWGSKAYYGHLYLAAHFATRAINASTGAAAPSGAITSRSIGSISTSYAAAAAEPSDGDLGGTAYGQLYLLLRRSILVVPLTAGYGGLYT